MKDLADQVAEVRRKSDQIMAIKVLVDSVFVNVMSVYAPQVGLPDDTKKLFWEELDEVIQEVPRSEKLFIGGDFNGISARRQRDMMGSTGASISERETRKGSLCWIL